MNWVSLEISVHGSVHKGRYRLDGHVIEVESRLGRRRAPKTSVRPDIIAQNMLRQIVRVASLSAQAA